MRSLTYEDLDRLSAEKRLRAIQIIRDSYPLPATRDEMYGTDDKIKSNYIEHRPAEAALQAIHKKSRKLIPPEVELTPGLLQAMKKPLWPSQMTHRLVWAVMWQRRDLENGHIRKGKKSFTSLGAAIGFWGKIKPEVPTATVVSLRRGYDVPPVMRGRLPRGWFWCPRCMMPRRFQRDPYERWFEVANKKVWNNTKQKYEFTARRVVYLHCPMCGCTNREPAWRRSNQPWERRRIKQGVHRLRKSQRGHKMPGKKVRRKP